MNIRPLFLTLVFSLVSAHIALGQSHDIIRAVITFDFVSKDVQGSIAGFRSSSSIDYQKPENSVFKGSVDVETLDTNNGLRNWSLKNRRYFDADTHPRIRFESTEVVKNQDRWTVKGKLTLKGTTKPLSIAFEREGDRLIGHTELFSSDYGIYVKKKRQDNLVRVKMVFDLK